MCYQYSCTLSSVQIGNCTGAKPLDFVDWQPQSQVRVGAFMPVITNEFSGIIQYFKWGLVPVWAKTIAMGNTMYNTKLENLQEKPALQAIYRYKRCLIPATDFTIWTDKKKGISKTVASSTGSLFLCGLWDVWGEGLQSFSILTHHKNGVDYPLLLSMMDKDKWLSKKAENLSLVESLCNKDRFM